MPPPCPPRAAARPRRRHGGARGRAPRARTARDLRAILDSLRGLRAEGHRQAARLRRRQSEGAGDVRRRGAGPRRGHQGLPFVGRSGQTARPDAGRHRPRPHAASTSPTSCRGGRPATARRRRRRSQICLPFMQRQIELVDPDILVCLGGPSAQTLLGITDGITRTRGRWFKFDTGKREIRAIATFHPAYLLRSPLQKRLAWRDFLRDQEGAALEKRRTALPTQIAKSVPAGGISHSQPRPAAISATLLPVWLAVIASGAEHMDFDPVLLARLQFAFTISFHIIFPSFTIGLSAYIATLAVLWAGPGTTTTSGSRGSGPRSSPSPSPWAWCPASCCPTVRHQLEPLLGRRRQHHRPADRLRGADRVLPGGDLPRHHAVRRRPRAALAACVLRHRGRGRHRDLGVLDPLRQ